MLGLHDEMGLAIEFDHLAFADIVSSGHDGKGDALLIKGG
jgi:hypothetical protein